MSFKIAMKEIEQETPEGLPDMIICQCTGTTDNGIKNLIREGAASVADIVRRSGCGRCCAPCRQEIADILRQQLATAGD
jgi:bacterioferritin-associated ferredoxin